ncbi:TolC family protein [Limnovirga soli]|uniref:TolC family protein n=1 Tax=Limnovirga soli TaxID=2656915 RepID=A0A8J8JVK1_9BACT|nr:TolC family protein [Limnovirga soli]NNV56704.1 TolC family protein [Limnovirga soli]
MQKANMYYGVKIIGLLLGMALSVALHAQEKAKPLLLEKAIKTAIDSNSTISLALIDEQIAAANFKQTEAIFLPQAALSYTAYTTNNPLNAFGFKLQQQRIQQSDFNPALLNAPGGTPNFATQFTVQQPLLNMDMLYLRKTAEKQTALYQFKTQRTKELIIWQVQQAYLQLQFTYEAKAVLEQALTTATAMQKFTNDRFNQGLLQKSDLLNAAVQVKTVESNLADINSSIQNISDQLSVLMHQPTGIAYSTINMEALPEMALDTLNTKRSDFMAMETAIATYDLLIKSSKMSYLPKLNAFANYQLNDKSMLGFGSGAYLAGVQLQWDIFKGNQTKNKIAVQSLEKNKLAAQLASEKEAAGMELKKTYRQLQDAVNKITVQQAAVDQASEALRILQNRYQQGLANTTDLLFAQTQLSQQQLNLAQAKFSRSSTLAYIQFLTSKS